MMSWKDKVAEKLARLLADVSSSSFSSSPSSPPTSLLDSPVAPPQPQSYDSSSHKSSSSTQLHSGLRSHSSTLPGSLKQNGSAGKERLSNSIEENETEMENNGMNGFELNFDYFKVYHANASHSLEEASAYGSADFNAHLTEKSTFLHANLFEFFQSCLPNIVKGCQWTLLYSTRKHGISLRTLIRESISHPSPCLLIVGDMNGAVFGGLLDSPLKPTAKMKYQGTNQAFVFTTIYGQPRLFRATGANRYYYICMNDALAFGGGGNFALSLDEDLLHGTSGPSETFGNSCLAHSPEFEVKDVELWGFAHSLRLLT